MLTGPPGVGTSTWPPIDGYAIADADLARDSATIVSVAGRISAGQTADGQGARGTAVRIFTGAPAAARAGTVFVQKDVRLLGDRWVEPPRVWRAGPIAVPSAKPSPVARKR
jgi:molybdopterin biosynthesis enzyme